MKKYFVTGLVILLPLAMTFVVVGFLVNLFTNPFVDVVTNFLDYNGWLQNGFLFLSGQQLRLYVSRTLILVLLFFLTVALGVLTRWVIVHYLIRLGDYIFHRIPIVSSVYKTSQEVIKTIFGTTTRSFKQVVLAPFPNKDTYSMGLVTRDHIPAITKEGENSLVAVFVPTTPNPTSGFLMMFEKDDLVYLDIKVEEAFKYIISCGVVMTPFHPIEAKTEESDDS